jgi:probable F420-dependent oxidoreductase
VRYGFYLPTRGATATPDALGTILDRAEALGLDSAMISDHVVFPVEAGSRYPYTVSGAFPGTGEALEQLALAAFVAGRTRRLRIVTSVMIVPYRHPVLAAKVLATIDVLSSGRLTVGVGAGWLREEFEALGAPDFTRRGAATDESLTIFKLLWTECPASFEGRFHRFQDVQCLPRPVQHPHPPIWVGGHSRAALRRAVAHGDGWHPVGANAAVPLTPRELGAMIAELRQMADKAGRDPGTLAISFKAPVYDRAAGAPATTPGGERMPFTGARDEVVGDVRTYAELGVSEIVFDFRSERLADTLERMEQFAADVKAAV